MKKLLTHTQIFECLKDTKFIIKFTKTLINGSTCNNHLRDRFQILLHPRLSGRERRVRLEHEREGDDLRPHQHGGQVESPQRSGARRQVAGKGHHDRPPHRRQVPRGTRAPAEQSPARLQVGRSD